MSDERSSSIGRERRAAAVASAKQLAGAGSYAEGQRSRGICSACKAVVETTIRRRDIPVDGEPEIARGVLAAVCDQCGQVVAIPHQKG